ncbi:MAG: exodeoxyribonuclease VII small subunit [Defluviitaleaceae bacterium]|nr:exodeoxyribonuclease VII small subunit [Defluviitaleaceae bacterium]
MNFEASMDKLETILEILEAPETTLDASLALYKEGIALAKSCGEILKNTETEVQRLQKEAEGIFTTLPFGDDHD